MSRFAGKLSFIHRRLWQRDVTYRLAVLLGPPPLLGLALAAAAWFGLHSAAQPSVAGAPWAHPETPRFLANTAAPRTEAPDAPLPTSATNGGLVGFRSGWQGVIEPVAIGATLDANVLNKTLATYATDQPDIDISTILVAAGPQSGLYVGVQSAALAIRTEGDYAIAVRAARYAPELADCLVRFVFKGARLVSNLTLNFSQIAPRDYPPYTFHLKPGLYEMAAAIGCWHDQKELGTGRMSVLIRGPNETALRPAEPNEIVRPATPPR